MPEIESPVKINKVTYACDDCYGKPHSGCILKKVIKFWGKDKYKCPNCKKVFELENEYPFLRYRDVPCDQSN